MSRKPARTAAPPAEAASRILIAAHSHPAVSRGGAEIAAWRHYQAMQGAGWQSWFMGAAREAATRAGSAITQPFGPDQYLYTSTSFDWFKFANPDPNFPREFRALLRDLRPDVVHFHHYAVFGVEAFLHIRETLPDCKIVLTLHEFQAICNHYGQMVKRERQELCHAASLRECNRCFPEYSRADFFLRQTYAQRFLGLVDHFIAPSQFLADRYIAWGLDAARMNVIENIIAAPAGEAAPARQGARLRIGYFGQISSLKGIDVLLDAAALLEADGNTAVQIEVHGDHTNQPAEFQARFTARLADTGRNVRFHGPYGNEQVDRLMAGVDAVVVPSVWWENAPVVIQECLRNRRPVICSDIGGMAEKVRDGVDGLHFPVGDAVALADLLAALAVDRARLTAIATTMRGAAGHDEMLASHLRLYAALRTGD
ncbi:MAG: glycosyltransferase [Alphaproteobacteria bacterium]|nr:glycosyltransferase [Alphaproteobacteria bacterium]